MIVDKFTIDQTKQLFRQTATYYEHLIHNNYFIFDCSMYMASPQSFKVAGAHEYH